MAETLFQVGKRLTFTTKSPLYRDIYETEVVGVYPDHIDLRLTLHQGYLLLLPTGTLIRWLDPSLAYGAISTVLVRNIQAQTWSVTYPESSVGQRTRVLAIGSGKGGVGKTTFAINLSLALSNLQQRVVLLDADIGMANVEVLLGLASSRNIEHVLRGECRLTDVLLPGPGGIQVIPGSSGLSSLKQLDNLQFNRVLAGFAELESMCDLLILDTGAGLSEVVLRFLGAADDVILVTNPEPHALMDAYALTKALVQRTPGISPMLVLNRCESEREARQSLTTLVSACERFLRVQPVWLGWLPYDKHISRSLKDRLPLVLSHPHLNFCREVHKIAEDLIGIRVEAKPTGFMAFLQRLKKV